MNAENFVKVPSRHIYVDRKMDICGNVEKKIDDSRNDDLFSMFEKKRWSTTTRKGSVDIYYSCYI